MADTRVRRDVGLPRVFDPVVTCPAGEPIAEASAGSGCQCRVEDSMILAATSPRSLVLFCLGGYTACPTWTAEKERIWEAQRTRLVDRPHAY